MDDVEKLKTQNLLEFVQKCFLQEGKKETSGVRFTDYQKKDDISLVVYQENNIYNNYTDYKGPFGGGSIIDFYMNFFNVNNATAIQKLKEIYKIESEKKEFIKQPKREELFTNFSKYQNFDITFLKKFLMKRGFTFEQIELYKENIIKVSKEIGFFPGLFVEKGVYKDTLIFPCYDENYNIKGVKLRTCDLTPFKNKSGQNLKSPSVKATGLLYNQSDLNNNQVIICEGEIDYLILKILGFTSIIGNLGGVQSNMETIKFLTKEIKEIVSFYDNDDAGQQANQKLQKELGRDIKIIKYPTDDKVDINDLFNRGFYKKEDFEKMINPYVVSKKQPLYKNRFFYDDTNNNFFDLKKFSFLGNKALADILFLKPKEVQDLRMEGLIPTYDGLTYWQGGKPLLYNLYDDDDLIKKSDNPEINPIIYEFLSNLFSYNQENIEWIMKAILYKYTHINDVYIPAVIMHGPGGSGKGLFIKLLEQIFAKKNVLKGLGQSDINSQFTTYSGQKLIVSFNEVLVDGTANGKKNMAKLKNLIMEEEVFIEKKGQDKISIENIAWFFLSSNEAKPVQLDGSASGNRRFTVIKTGQKLKEEDGKEIENIIMDKKNIEDFIAFLFESFPNIENEKYILPLDNQDKRDLEELCESVGNLFFKWFEGKFPNINKITTLEMKYFLAKYREEINEDDYDERYKIRNFNSGLDIKYQKKKSLSIRGISPNGYYINKEIEGSGYFLDNKYEEFNN